MPTEQAQRFMDWARASTPTMADYAIELLERYADRVEGRFRIAQSYVIPAERMMQMAIHAEPGSTQEAQRVCLQLENFIGLFPEGERFIERFIEPLMSLRECLIELYAYISPRYTWDHKAPRPEEPYTGPRVSRYERPPVI